MIFCKYNVKSTADFKRFIVNLGSININQEPDSSNHCKKTLHLQKQSFVLKNFLVRKHVLNTPTLILKLGKYYQLFISLTKVSRKYQIQQVIALTGLLVWEKNKLFIANNIEYLQTEVKNINYRQFNKES